MEIAAAFAEGEPAGTRALFILGGLVSVAFGVVLFAHPGAGAITLALLFGLFNLAYGAWALVQGIELRRTREEHPLRRHGKGEDGGLIRWDGRRRPPRQNGRRRPALSVAESTALRFAIRPAALRVRISARQPPGPA